jgi:hypothetical protein
MSRLTSLRTRCYDPAGVGCYDNYDGFLLVDLAARL